jgi:transcriptional regulator
MDRSSVTSPDTALFSGPHAYVSPRWYQTRQNVPTWNYSAVYVRGAPRVVGDPDKLLALLDELTARFESGLEGAWSTDELPRTMLDKLVDSIVGFEIDIESIDGKFKLNQNRTTEDREGVIDALSASTHSNDREIAALMLERAK